MVSVVVDPVVRSHVEFDPSSECPGMLRAWDEGALWRLTACDACGCEVGFRVGFNRPAVSATSEQEW